jgi:hypothetical protein
MSMMYIGIAAVMVSAAGTAVSVNAQQEQAKAAEYTGEYNEELQRQQAIHETQVANKNARRKTRENAKIIGLQREAVAASGLAMAGTPLAILGESVMTLERDIMNMGYEAAARATQLRSGAEMSLWEGRTTAGAMRTAAVGTAISGVASAANRYFTAKGLNAPKSTAPKTTY